MADPSFGLRHIALDVAGVVTARVVRDATKSEISYLSGITVSGTTGAGAGTIVLREDSASGPILWKFTPANGTLYNFDVAFSTPIKSRGLYVDVITTAWAANSVVILHIT